MSTPARWRAGDADREQVAGALRTAHAEGRIGLDEFGERLDAAFAATYVDELVPLTADLPPDDAAVEVVRPARRTRPDQRWQGLHGAWSGANPTPYGGRPAAHGCSGWAGLPGRWVGLFVLLAVVLAIVAVAAGGAPWPLLWLAVAFVVLRGRPRSGLGRSS